MAPSPTPFSSETLPPPTSAPLPGPGEERPDRPRVLGTDHQGMGWPLNVTSWTLLCCVFQKLRF